jgi:hypothetical protein
VKKLLLMSAIFFATTACNKTKGQVRETMDFLAKEGDLEIAFFEGNDVYLAAAREIAGKEEKALQISRMKTDTDLSAYREKPEDEQMAAVDSFFGKECGEGENCPRIAQVIGGRSALDLDVDGKVDVYLYLEREEGGKEKFYGINLKTGQSFGDDPGASLSEIQKAAQNEYAKMLEAATKEIKQRKK